MALQTESPVSKFKTDSKKTCDGLDYDWTRNLDKRFLCPICLGIMKEPQQTKCGHRFCLTCIHAVIGTRERTKCPVDNTIFVTRNDIFSDLAFEREIKSVRFSCPNKDEGCDWSAELTAVKDHYSTCPYQTVPCDECGKPILLKNLPEHQSTQCPQRIIECQHCNQRMPEIEKMKHHVVSCHKFPVNCPQCGQSGFQRNNISLHTDIKSGDCPATVVPCYYQPFGCAYRDERHRLGPHLNEATEHHHLLLVNEMAHLKHTLMTTQHDLTSHLIASQETENKLKSIQRTVEMNDTVQRIFKENYSGCILWQVDVSSSKDRFFQSPSFYTSSPGYRVSATLDLTSCSGASDSAVTFALRIEDGKYDPLLTFPFSGLCQVTVFDQSEAHCPGHHTALVLCKALPRFSHSANVLSSQECHRLMSQADFLSNRYLRNGVVFVEVKVMQTVFSLLKK